MTRVSSVLSQIPPMQPIQRSRAVGSPVVFGEDKREEQDHAVFKFLQKGLKKLVFGLLVSVGLLTAAGFAIKRYVIPPIPKPPAPVWPAPSVQPQKKTISGTVQRHFKGAVESLTVLDDKSGVAYMIIGNDVPLVTQEKLVYLKPWLEPGVRVWVKGQISDRPETQNLGPVFELEDMDIQWQTVTGVVQAVVDANQVMMKVAPSHQDIKLDLSRLSEQEKAAFANHLKPGDTRRIIGLYAQQEETPRRFYMAGLDTEGVKTENADKTGGNGQTATSKFPSSSP